MYFSQFDDWSHDRFNEKENTKNHGWRAHPYAMSGIKFFGNASLQTAGQPSVVRNRPMDLTERNHFFQAVPTAEDICPQWMQVRLSHASAR